VLLNTQTRPLLHHTLDQHQRQRLLPGARTARTAQ